MAVNCIGDEEDDGAPLIVTATTGSPTSSRCVEPMTPWYVARTSSSPRPTTVTTPVDDTVASVRFDDSHAAAPVTSRALPSDIFAVAVN